MQSSKELANRGGDLRAVRLKREVARVIEADLGIRYVASERLCSLEHEQRSVLSPDRKYRRTPAQPRSRLAVGANLARGELVNTETKNAAVDAVAVVVIISWRHRPRGSKPRSASW